MVGPSANYLRMTIELADVLPARHLYITCEHLPFGASSKHRAAKRRSRLQEELGIPEVCPVRLLFF